MSIWLWFGLYTLVLSTALFVLWFHRWWKREVEKDHERIKQMLARSTYPGEAYKQWAANFNAAFNGEDSCECASLRPERILMECAKSLETTSRDTTFNPADADTPGKRTLH
ncbi:MAG: hypothetical protein AAB343_04235 [Patescibacteria group bacterium]